MLFDSGFEPYIGGGSFLWVFKVFHMKYWPNPIVRGANILISHCDTEAQKKGSGYVVMLASL